MLSLIIQNFLENLQNSTKSESFEKGKNFELKISSSFKMLKK